MNDYTRPPGKTTIAPEVLISIAQLTALSVPGVSRLVPVPVNVNRLFRKGTNEGVDIQVENGTVYADLFIAVQSDVNIRQIGRSIQQSVARAISEMVGMEVGGVTIHVEEIDYNVESVA
jgi:uncharacterized alkaline shock family protein YloU